MTPELEGFLVDLGVAVLTTVVLLVIAIITGVKRKRSMHYAFVTLTFVALGTAVWSARKVGPFMSYDEAGLWIRRVHFTFVGVTTLFVPFVILSGARLGKALMLAERGDSNHDAVKHRASHKRIAWWAVIVIVITCALGTAMTIAGLPA